MKLAFMFVGQGAQKVGMGKDFYDRFPEVRALYDNAELDFDIKKLCFEGPDEQLTDTAYVQSCLLLTSYAMAKCLRSEGIVPEAVCGLSLGEYTALTDAGALSLEEALVVTRKRGELMAHALPAGTGMMAAVMGAEESLVQEACAAAGGICEVANYNCPGQIVISGEKAAVEAACAYLKEKGVRRVIPLKVSGAFHSSLLKPAAKELADVLEGVNIAEPQLPVITNTSGDYLAGDIAANLTRQMYSSVYFEKGIRRLLADGYDTFVEVGPGKALSGFVKKIDRAVQVMNVEDLDSFAAVVDALG